MKQPFLLALALGGAAIPAAVSAQVTATFAQPIAGTKLDITATGEVTRVPDVAIISAGVVTRSTTATAAIQENADRMERVRAALSAPASPTRTSRRRTSASTPNIATRITSRRKLVGYTASNQVSIRFRDIRNSGRILDALVSQGANQINGPNLTIDHPESALDEARAKAATNGRARAELYARALGMRVVRLLSVSESGGYAVPPPMPVMMGRGRWTAPRPRSIRASRSSRSASR